MLGFFSFFVPHLVADKTIKDSINYHIMKFAIKRKYAKEKDSSDMRTDGLKANLKLLFYCGCIVACIIYAIWQGIAEQ